MTFDVFKLEYSIIRFQVNKDDKVTQAQVEHKASEIKIRAANMVRSSVYLYEVRNLRINSRGTACHVIG